MKRSLKIFLLLAVFSFKVNAQSCLHTDLSKKFDYKITRQNIVAKGNIGQHTYPSIIIEIFDKKSKLLFQKITENVEYLDERGYANCNNVRSYITGKNKNAAPPDWDYGDVVIADLNFDGKEDIAVKTDSGGAGGPRYDYYIQDDKGRFVIDSYLSKNLYSFPANIDQVSHTLTITIFATYTKLHEYIYRYDKRLRKWSLLTSKYLKV